MLLRSTLMPTASRNPWYDFDRFFSDFASAPAAATAPAVVAAIDAIQDGEGYVLKMDIPGVPASELQISVEGDTVQVSGERKADTETKKENYVRRERTAGKFSRTVTLPYQVDNSKVEAKVKDGVLTLTLPKREADKPRRVEVKAA